MSLLGQLRRAASSVLRRRGLEIVESAQLYEWQRTRRDTSSFSGASLPPGADTYLRQNNARLIELTRRYVEFNAVATIPLVWAEGYVTGDNLAHFRGDNPYVWQLRGQNMNELSYALTAYYARCIDRLGFLDQLKEDGAFGAYTFEVDGLQVSRDLLDSIVEIYFLERQLHLSQQKALRILDIGAGYGRLAHRMTAAIAGLRCYYCTDAVPVSTFICEYYLGHRGLNELTQVVPLDEIDAVLSTYGIDLAVNVHSFSECKLDAIDWWIGKLRSAKVRHLFVVPNGADPARRRLLTVDGNDFGPTIQKHGYSLVACEAKYRDPVVQSYGISPAYHFLFRLE